jgi:long-chain acyl-CoA synthetase
VTAAPHPDQPPPARNLCDIFYGAVDAYAKPRHLLYKKDGVWRAVTSDEFRAAVEELSLGLRALGLLAGDRVAILAENRPEWAYADLATLAAGAEDVPVYPSLTAPQVLYILKDSEAKVAFVSNAAQAAKVAQVRAQAPALVHVIRMGEEALPGTLSLAEVREKGRSALAADPAAVRGRAAALDPEGVATVIYTSGTTGDPKGVMLSHRNIVSNVAAATKVFPVFGPQDVALSFLPLCHIFERMAGHYLMLSRGVTIAYAESVEAVPANMAEVRPTVMFSVPRLYEKMHARILEKVAADPPLRRRIFRWGLEVGQEAFRHRVRKTRPPASLRLQRALAERLVFAKIKKRVGGRLRVFVSGGAPLSREIAEFFGAVGLLILEGYGLTETSPVITVNRPDDFRPGTVGPPVDGVEVKIAPDGEILTRGPHVMKGYYKRPEDTAEAIDKDGWFHTGDIGFLEDGFLTITDRKKDLIVTSGGKKIAPQPIEGALKRSPLIAEVVMIGNRRNFPAALVVPRFEALEAWARSRGIAFRDREELVRRPEIVARFEQEVKEAAGELAKFEQIKKIALLPREFSLEGGELTPTLKVKRRVVEQKYKDMIDRMYEAAPAAAAR